VVAAFGGKLHAAEARMETDSFQQRWVTSESRRVLGADSDLPSYIAVQKQRFYQRFSDVFYEELDKRFQTLAPQTVGETLDALKSAFTRTSAAFPVAQRVGVTPRLILDGIARADTNRNDFDPYIFLDDVRSIADDADVRRAVQGKRQRFMAPMQISIEFENGEGAHGATAPIATLGENIPLTLDTAVSNARFGRLAAPGQTACLDASDLFAGVTPIKEVKALPQQMTKQIAKPVSPGI
jgi:hypothetical protein